jgi:phenol 2-monooxygenase
VHTITPEEVLEQANKIFSPYKLKFAAPLSWFAVWKSKLSDTGPDFAILC